MNVPKNPKDTWVSADAYEPYVGRWSRLVALQFLRWLSVPRNARWLDVGCGTGALSQAILSSADPASLIGVDQSAEYAGFASSRMMGARAHFGVADAGSLPVRSGAFDAAVSALVLNFMAEPAKMVSEMKRALHIGGLIALYVWDYAGQMQLMRYFWDAAVALSPDARDLDEGRRFPICHPEMLRGLFQAAGLAHVETAKIDIETRFLNFDDYWNPFLGGQGPAPSYVMALDDGQRTRLRDLIRDALPISRDGSISLMARAWAVKGITLAEK